MANNSLKFKITSEQNAIIKEVDAYFKTLNISAAERNAVMLSFVDDTFNRFREEGESEAEIMERVLEGKGFDLKAITKKIKINKNKPKIKTPVFKVLHCGAKASKSAVITIYKSGRNYIENHTLKEMGQHAVISATLLTMVSFGSKLFNETPEKEVINKKILENTDVPENKKPDVIIEKPEKEKITQKTKPEPIVTKEEQKKPEIIIKKDESFQKYLNMSKSEINDFIKGSDIPVNIQNIDFNYSDHYRKALLAWAYTEGYEKMSNLAEGTIAKAEGTYEYAYVDPARRKNISIARGIALTLDVGNKFVPMSIEDLTELMQRSETKMSKEQIKLMYDDLNDIAELNTKLDILYAASDLERKDPAKYSERDKKYINLAWDIQVEYGKDGKVMPRKQCIKNIGDEIHKIVEDNSTKSTRAENFDYAMTTEGIKTITFDYVAESFSSLTIQLKNEASKLGIKDYNPTPSELLDNPMLGPLMSVYYQQRGITDKRLFKAFVKDDLGTFFSLLIDRKAYPSRTLADANEMLKNIDKSSADALLSLDEKLSNEKTKIVNSIEGFSEKRVQIALGSEAKNFTYTNIVSTVNKEKQRRENNNSFQVTLNHGR